MMFAIMSVSNTHRFSWRPWKPTIALIMLIMIGVGTLAPIAAPFAHAVDPTPAPAPTVVPTPPGVAPAAQVCGTSGDTLSTGRCIFFTVITELMLLIASLLGRILVFMVDILIAFASYNDFGGTEVVKLGWVMVRDVVNMFFIIILLVSAFATVIGYDEGSFHYKRVLPKLLLMAVLINFSRTLILLLVDFSQVLMLTFVNAFAQAGPGNLVSALKIDAVLKFAPVNATADTNTLATAQAAAGVQPGAVDQMNLLLAIMLGIFMLSISLGVVTIMVGYLIFRIVGLWVALILSPIALFATALPGRLQKGMDNFTGKYWQRLTAMLTGGPVMAFFLWLTFAVTQKGTESSQGLSQVLHFTVQNPTMMFLTSVGNSQDIASFIVGITLMLMGLDAAVSSASAVSDTLGGFAKKTASASKALGSLAATAPFLGAYYAGRGTARYVDRRADISGRAATGVAATLGQVPILRSFIRKPLMAAMTKNKRLDAEEAKNMQAGMEGMTDTQRAIMANATPSSFMATKGQRNASAQQMLDRAAPKNAQAIKDELMPGKIDQFTNQSNMGNLQANLKKAQAIKDPAEKNAAVSTANSAIADEQRKIHAAASRDVDRDVAERQSGFLADAMKTAKAAGNQDMVRGIEEQYKKNPQINPDRRAAAKATLSDKAALNGMSDQAKGHVGFAKDLMSEAKAFERDKDGKISGVKRAEMDGFMDKITNKDTRENYEMVQRYIEGQVAAGHNVSDEELNGLSVVKNEKGKVVMTQRGSMAPVMHEGARNAMNALNSAKADVQIPPTEKSLDALRTATVESVKQRGLKDTLEGEGADSHVMDQLLVEIKEQVGRGELGMASSLGRDIKGLGGPQQEALAGQIADTLLPVYEKLRSEGKTNSTIDSNTKNIVEVAVSISNDLDKRGKKPVGTSQTNIVKVVEEVRKALNSKDKDQRGRFPQAWKVIAQPEDKP